MTTSSSSSSIITAKQQKIYFNKYYNKTAKDACEFLTSSTDPYYAVQNSITKLQQFGFQPLSLHKSFTAQNLVAGGKYYYHVHHTALVAFVIGGSVPIGKEGEEVPSQEPIGFHIIGGHTDSPNLKLKPRSQKGSSNTGCQQLGVQCYGGGLWHTWLDRDLSISGKVLVRNNSADNKIESKLVKLTSPIARVSTLCIHLQTGEERKALVTNKEQHTIPIIATNPKDLSSTSALYKQILEDSITEQINVSGDENVEDDDDDPWTSQQEPYLLQTIAEELKLSSDTSSLETGKQEEIGEIVDWDLNLYDTQPASIGGICNEFLYSARLDNLATVYCAVTSLVNYVNTCGNGNDADASSPFQLSKDISIVVAFDHEEVGSTSAEGAGSPIITSAIKRIATAINGNGTTTDLNIDIDWYTRCIEKSFILSIDMAHAIHPNFSNKHDSQHSPKLNGGIVIKTNCNQRYTTSGNTNTGFIIRELCRRRKQRQQLPPKGTTTKSGTKPIPIQEFVVKNDCPCGSTIGPTLSASTGIRTVDAGMPQLSMHSCREVMGIADLTHCLDLFQEFFTNFRELDDSLNKELS